MSVSICETLYAAVTLQVSMFTLMLAVLAVICTSYTFIHLLFCMMLQQLCHNFRNCSQVFIMFSSLTDCACCRKLHAMQPMRRGARPRPHPLPLPAKMRTGHQAAALMALTTLITMSQLREMSSWVSLGKVRGARAGVQPEAVAGVRGKAGARARAG